MRVVTSLPHSMLLVGIPALLLGGAAGLVGYGVGAGWAGLPDPRMFGGIAFFGAFFGVCAARFLWRKDFEHARHIDEIRSRTEAALRGTISSLERSASR